MAMHKWKTSGLTLLIGSSFGWIPNPVNIIFNIFREEQDECEFSSTIIISENQHKNTYH